MWIYGSDMDGESMKNVILQLVMAFVGSLGFAMLFRLRRALWISASLGGVFCWGGYLLVMYFSDGQIFTSGLAAAALAGSLCGTPCGQKKSSGPAVSDSICCPTDSGKYSVLYNECGCTGKYRRSVTLWQSDTSVCIVHCRRNLYRMDAVINFQKILCLTDK